MTRVVTALSGGVLSLTLNRPEKRNALDGAAVDALRAGLERAALDAAVRVVAIRGAGKDFCAGADLAELLASRDRPPAENEADALRLGEVFLAIRRLAQPVVALVQGRALAGGCGLATACDLVVAADTAQFGFPEVQRGFVPAMVLAILRRQVGERVACDLALTSRVLGAEEALSLGLVSRVVPADRLGPEGDAILAGLAAGSPTALCLTKRLLYELDGPSFEEGIRLGARINALARSTPDFRAAVERFLA